MSNFLQAKSFSILAACAALALLAGCVSGRPAPDTYTSRSGTVTAIESDRESCVRTCNNDFERCGDMLSTVRSDVSDQPSPKPFGMKAECQDSLRSCLDRCKGR